MTNSPAFWIGYIVLIFAFMYFIAIRPQQKEKKKMQELMASIAVGDSVLTSSGFYGVIIDMTDDTVIVEFGNNKNCRIPMQKQAVSSRLTQKRMCLGTFSRLAQSLATIYIFARVRVFGTFVPFYVTGNSSEFPVT